MDGRGGSCPRGGVRGSNDGRCCGPCMHVRGLGQVTGTSVPGAACTTLGSGTASAIPQLLWLQLPEPFNVF